MRRRARLGLKLAEKSGLAFLQRSGGVDRTNARGNQGDIANAWRLARDAHEIVGVSAWSDRDDQSQERSFRNPGRQSNHCWLERQRNGEGPNCRSTGRPRLLNDWPDNRSQRQDRQGGSPWLKSLAQISRNIRDASLGYRIG